MMKLLILTQKVDKNDAVLGFFHTWVREFAKHCDEVTIVALGVGEYDLPENVRVFSLGKEKGGQTRFNYIYRFYRYVWHERKRYDHVFVHMNDEYVVLGGWLWRMKGKPIAHWRNHPKGGWMIDLAMRFSTTVYATSPYAYVKRQYSDRVTLMPVGVDTDTFTPTVGGGPPDLRSILFFGRISPIKKVHLFLESLLLLRDQGVEFNAQIIGDPHNPEDTAYVAELNNFIREHELSDRVTIAPGIPNRDAPELYRRYGVYVNLTTTGSYDKTIFEAMASGLLVITSNRALEGSLPSVFLAKEDDPESLAECLKNALASTSKQREEYRQQLREYVIERHSLKELAKRLFPAE